MLQVNPIKTSIFKTGDNLVEFLTRHLQEEPLEGHIIAITSKVVSLDEKMLVPQSKIEKSELIKQEADHYIGHGEYDCHLTIKEGLLIPSAGIDESNSETGDYILYPADPFSSARKLAHGLRKSLGVRKLGVILTDSRTSPLRKGVSGVALAYYGFDGLRNLIGNDDLFGCPLKVTTINIADALAAAATLCIGEGNESCPAAIIKYPVDFKETENNNEIRIDPEEDLYWPILSGSTKV